MNNSMNNQTGSQNKTQNTKTNQTGSQNGMQNGTQNCPRCQGFQNPEHALTYFREKIRNPYGFRIFIHLLWGRTMVKRLPHALPAVDLQEAAVLGEDPAGDGKPSPAPPLWRLRAGSAR